MIQLHTFQNHNGHNPMRQTLLQRLMQATKARKIYVEKHKKDIVNHQHRNHVVPKRIYQTWHTLELPPKMRLASQQIQDLHPDFEYLLFDDNMMRSYIHTHFDTDVKHAFDALIPGAYKADLWRYCVLYREGGIYMDIKYMCCNEFTFHELLSSCHYVFDEDFNNIYNALLVSPLKNPVFLACIRQIVTNVKHKFYGKNVLYPTGPALLRHCLPQRHRQHIVMYHCSLKDHEYLSLKRDHNLPRVAKLILLKGAPVLSMFEGYYKEQEEFKHTDHYTVLWNRRSIYR